MSTLHMNSDTYIKRFPTNFGLTMSMEFATCADQQLSALFERDAGFKIGKGISIGWAHWTVFFYTKDTVSKFASEIWINNSSNNVVVAWQSRSGRIYDTADTDIDCTDIQFWFEGFDALLYQKQYYPKDKLPFKLKDLSYELVVTRLNMDQTVAMTLKPFSLPKEESITKEIDQFMEDYNEVSEKKDRKYGVIHNWKSTRDGHLLIYDIDMGFTGAYFMKKLLQFLSDLDVFEKVEIM